MRHSVQRFRTGHVNAKQIRLHALLATACAGPGWQHINVHLHRCTSQG
jgi:hypothetical protein